MILIHAKIKKSFFNRNDSGHLPTTYHRLIAYPWIIGQAIWRVSPIKAQ